MEENEDDIQFVSVSSSGIWGFPSQRLCGTSRDVISPRLFTHRPANVWTSHTDWTLWSRAQEWVSDWTPWSRTQERVSEWTPWSRAQEWVSEWTLEQDTGAGISGHRGAGHRSERLFLNHAKTLGFLAPGGEEFNPGPETRRDCSELLCNSFIKV